MSADTRPFRNPFTTRPIEERGLLGKLFVREDPDNGYIALENLLATSDWNALDTTRITAALREHGVTEVDREKMKAIYGRALKAFAEDENLTDEEAGGLLRLRDLLGLRDFDVSDVEGTIVEAQYDRVLRDLAADEQLTPDENARLERLRRGLRIRERHAIDALKDAGSALLDDRWNIALRDRRLSDVEMKAIEAMAANFGLRPSFALGGDKHVDRCRWMWLMEHGTFPAVECPIALHPGETCHHATAAALLERQTETTGYQLSTPGGSVTLMPGMSYRATTINVRPLTREVTQQTDTGTLYFTSERILFDGTRANRTYPWPTLLGVTPYTDGLQLERSDGPNAIFRLDDPEYLTVLITSRLAK
jgi:hypothetical protein